MKYLNDIPIFRAVVSGENQTMYAISLVDDPATESFWTAYEKEDKLMKFSIENEDKHIVWGLIMGAEQPILRRTSSNQYFYIVYDAETIRMMAEKYLKNGFQNNVDTMHNFELEDGINMVQMFIKDQNKGINPKGYEEYADGSLFAEFHVENEEIWNKIKDGTYKGFSLAGNFGVEEYFSAVEDEDYNECVELIRKIQNKMKNV